MTTTSRLADLQRTLAARLVPLAWANLVANILIVVTGGAVRLTGSGLGCPTWPKCTDESYTAHGALGIHGVIEFGNRLLTYVLLFIALAFVIAAWQRAGRVRTLALVVLAGIPAQAIVGGITVLTDLNPWVVAGHLLVSMAMVGVCVWILDELTGPVRPLASVVSTRLAWATFAVGWVVLWLGTVVTGSGPHSGDLESRRTGLDPATVSHIHGYSVWLLVVLTVALALVARRRGDERLAMFAAVLLVVELAQGLLGYVQYFTDLPEILVGLHMLGAAVIAAGLARVVVTTRARG
ncbi:COX15/CtaA family protein [Pimelobacter simplex]|uniref:COX15/CtaA family protein n=1 Tax=Nocardioides simplex TaxID=2045 RepID=UPI0021503BB2|nr:COX15/CtaA family protein [Pimelobacter simplex]UUW88158.1 COX15/CtaA family protein [Pimelobacter simplex]UUW97663.1 COX15/CtaA family protein [Pimelobacter simplex]